MIPKICEICGKQFGAYHSHNRFCSRACGVIGRSGPRRKHSVEIFCQQCGNPYRVKESLTNKSKFCSIKCQSDWKRIFSRGKLNPNFRNAGQKQCVGCGKRFKSYDKRRRFCGLLCTQQYSKAVALYAAKQGRVWEKDAAQKLRKLGYHCTVSRGSRGYFDIIAMSPFEILLIQVKSTNSLYRKFQKKDIRKLQKVQCPQNSIVRKQIMSHVSNRGWFIWENGNESTFKVTKKTQG